MFVTGKECEWRNPLQDSKLDEKNFRGVKYTLSECKEKCLLSKSCKSINIRKQPLVCYLNKRNTTERSLATSKGFTYYEKNCDKGKQTFENHTQIYIDVHIHTHFHIIHSYISRWYRDLFSNHLNNPLNAWMSTFHVWVCV